MLKSIFDEFDAIVASLEKDLYKPYVKRGIKLDLVENDLYPVINSLKNKASLMQVLDYASKLARSLPKARYIYSYLKDYFNAYKDDFAENYEESANALIEILKGFCQKKFDTRYYEKVYDPLFGSKDRIVLPIHFSTEDMKELENESNEFDRHKNYIFAVDLELLAYYYFESIGNREEAHQAYRHSQYLFEDLVGVSEEELYKHKEFHMYLQDGKYHYFTSGRVINAGKILDYALKHKKELDKVDLYYSIQELCTQFNQRNSIKKEKNYVIVISRHPYDIAGMSTDRGWRSCMNLIDGVHRDYVETTIKGGALIAYLCYADDTTAIKANGRKYRNNKINIQNPLGRVLIKPYIKSDEKFNPFRPNFLLIPSHVYGTFQPVIIKKLESWLYENWNKKVGEENETYEFDDEHFYQEESDYGTIPLLKP